MDKINKEKLSEINSIIDTLDKEYENSVYEIEKLNAYNNQLELQNIELKS